MHLTAQYVEVLRGRGGVHDADVVLRAQYEEPLESCGRVFGTLTLEAVRQQELPIYIVLTMRSDFFGDCSGCNMFQRSVCNASLRSSCRLSWASR